VRLQHVGSPSRQTGSTGRASSTAARSASASSTPRSLEEAGYETLPSRPIDERRRFFVRDPFGDFIELLSA
jgi:hypothetical protein